MANKRDFCGRTRRQFLWESGSGFGATALCGMFFGDPFFQQKSALAGDEETSSLGLGNPLAAKPGMIPAKAKSVIFLFMYGGPSHIDTFDYKPDMIGMDNQTIAVKTFGRGGHKSRGRIVEPR